MCWHHSNICGTSSSQLTARSTASLKTRRASACVAAMKTIRQDFSQGTGKVSRILGGLKTQTARLHAKKKFCANDVIPAYENYYKRVLAES